MVGRLASSPPCRVQLGAPNARTLIESSGEAKTEVIVAEADGVPKAGSRAEEAWIVAPRADAQNTLIEIVR